MSVARERQNPRLREAIGWLHDEMGWSYVFLGELAGEEGPISGTTISRWEDGVVSPQLRYQTAAYRLCDLHHFLTAVFADPGNARQWLGRYHPELAARPIELLERGDFDAVIGELASLESGAFF